VDNLTSAQTTARLQSTIEEQADVIISFKVSNTRLESAKEELEGDVEYYKEKYSNVINKLDKANETNERQKHENLKSNKKLKSENENLKRQLRGMNSSLFLIDLSLPCSSSVASASPSANRERGIGEIN
jgi:predicted nuclease with TOPRIM domain